MLKLTAAALTSASAPLAAAPEADGEALDVLAGRRGLRFGAAMSSRGLGDRGYRDLVGRQCGVIVCENEMKWRIVRPSAGTRDYSRADAIADFARKNGLALRGHALLFHHALNAAWRIEAARDGAEAVIRRHIGEMIGHYGSSVSSWDVVNEPIDPNGERPDLLRETEFLSMAGPGYIDLAFHAAREAAPEAELVLNDWVAPYRPAFFERHRTAVLRLLERLLRDGVPVDGLGVQSHLVAWRTDFDQRAWRKFLDDVAGLGLRILITELDVADDRLPAETGVRDKLVADHARRYLDVSLDCHTVSDVICWGLRDDFSAVRLTHRRKDGLPNRSLPYDIDNSAKPLRAAIASSLAGAPFRSTRHARRAT
jgi:endo-1,4-beta-xylanase